MKARLEGKLGAEREGVYEFTLIGKGCFTPLVNGEPKTVCLTDESLLEAIAQKLKGKPLFLNHETTPERVIGGVEDAWVENGQVKGKVEVLDEEIKKRLKYVKGLSIDAFVRVEENQIKEILEVEGMSLVVQPAWKGAQINASSARYTTRLDPSITTCIADTEWEADEAVERILKKGGWELLAKTVLVVETEDGKLPEKKSAYSFPQADVINGKVCWIKKAIASAKAYLNGARGVEIDPEKKKVALRALKKLEEKLKEVKGMCERCQKLEQELKAKSDELERLKRELQEKELRTYKLEAVQKLPENIRPIAQPAIEVAHTKEDVDKLVAQYSQMAQKITPPAMPAVNPAEPSAKEEGEKKNLGWLVIS